MPILYYVLQYSEIYAGLLLLIKLTLCSNNLNVIYKPISESAREQLFHHMYRMSMWQTQSKRPELAKWHWIYFFNKLKRCSLISIKRWSLIYAIFENINIHIHMYTISSFLISQNFSHTYTWYKLLWWYLYLHSNWSLHFCMCPFSLNRKIIGDETKGSHLQKRYKTNLKKNWVFT